MQLVRNARPRTGWIVQIAAMAVVLMTTASATPLTPHLMFMPGGLTGIGLVLQDQTDDWTDATQLGISCATIQTPMTVTLRVMVSLPGDVATLRVIEAGGNVLSQPTSGAPPVATIHAESADDCVHAKVVGTRGLAQFYALFAEVG